MLERSADTPLNLSGGVGLPPPDRLADPSDSDSPRSFRLAFVPWQCSAPQRCQPGCHPRSADGRARYGRHCERGIVCPGGDFGIPPSPVGSPVTPTEILSARTANSKTMDDGNGTRTTYFGQT